MIWRIQDAEGRGPFKPGMTTRWLRDEPDERLLPVYADIPDLSERIAKARRRMNGELYAGVACRSVEQLSRWFDERERQALIRLGYQCADASQCFVIGEGKSQIVIGWHLPLAFLPKVAWPTRGQTGHAPASSHAGSCFGVRFWLQGAQTRTSLLMIEAGALAGAGLFFPED